MATTATRRHARTVLGHTPGRSHLGLVRLTVSLVDPVEVKRGSAGRVSHVTRTTDGTVHALVTDHVDAFNSHDRPRLLAGLASDITWSTGADTFRGVQRLLDVFDDGLWALQPSLTITDLLVDENRAAAQMLEVLNVEDNSGGS